MVQKYKNTSVLGKSDIFKETRRDVYYIIYSLQSLKEKLVYTHTGAHRQYILHTKTILEIDTIIRCSFLCVSGQRGTIAKSMHEEHLCVVALTSMERGTQFFPLASYRLV